MSVYLDLWLLLYGALAGAGAVLLAKGSNRLIKGAVIGAVIVFLASLLRGLL